MGPFRLASTTVQILGVEPRVWGVRGSLLLGVVVR